MKIEYVGCYGEVEIDGYGIVKNGETIDVSKGIAEGLIAGREFKAEELTAGGEFKIEEKKEKTKKEKTTKEEVI